MKHHTKPAVVMAVLALLLLPAWVEGHARRWSEAQANAWYAHQPWLVGSNYVPTNAINQLEMWQAETFDPQQIDKELGWAEGLGMNTMRVFLHDLLWQQDSAAFTRRIDTFLNIADKHHIHPVFVLFDSCWEPEPKLGPQHPPIPGVHNSGWVQSPGLPALKDPSQSSRLKAYVRGVVTAFANDRRIVAWDVWNEPAGSPEVIALLPQVFAWAREAHPSQPLTSGVFQQNFAPIGPDKPTSVTEIQLAESDVLSFHNYSWPEDFEKHVIGLEKYNRPLLCTEYMARSAGSTLDTILPVAKKQPRRRHQLGIRERQDTNQFPVGFMGSPLRPNPAHGLVSRRPARGWHALPGARGRDHPRIDKQDAGKELATDVEVLRLALQRHNSWPTPCTIRAWLRLCRDFSEEGNNHW